MKETLPNLQKTLCKDQTLYHTGLGERNLNSNTSKLRYSHEEVVGKAQKSPIYNLLDTISKKVVGKAQKSPFENLLRRFF